MGETVEQLEAFAPNLWLCVGETLNFHGMPYSTRMTVVRLNSGHLWIHSPIKISDELVSQVSPLGEPRYLVSPNKLHHLYLQEWRDQFPNATLHAPPGLSKKRPDIEFDAEVMGNAGAPWLDEIDQTIFRGSPVMKEAVFFHRLSKTLILGDLTENFPQDHFSGWRKSLAKMTGIVSPNGKTPLDWRLTFSFGKKAAHLSLQQMLSWQPENIVLAHGECIKGNGTQALRESFSWL